MTDETNIYSSIRVEGQQRIAGMARHPVNHGTGEFVRGDVYTNTAEGFISLLSAASSARSTTSARGSLVKYVSEFEFRYNARRVADTDRPGMIVTGGEGKRLTYKHQVGARQN